MKKISNSEYKKQLSEIYGEYIQVARGSVFVDLDVCLDHRCLLCGTVTNVKPSTMLGIKKRKYENKKTVIEKVRGRGCSYCRTNADHIENLQVFAAELENVHKGKYKFVVQPAHFEIDTSHRHYFICTVCGQQHLQVPKNILRKEFQCSSCQQTTRSPLNVFYQQRLDVVFEKTITRVGNYHDTRPFVHECDKGHLWKTTAARTLDGLGCEVCLRRDSSYSRHRSIAQHQVEHQNKIFKLRTGLERIALSELIRKVKTHGEVKTAVTYPMPSLFGKTIPAFFHKKKNLLVDVFSRKKLKDKIGRIQKSLDRATELGYGYGVIVVDGKVAVGAYGSVEVQKMIDG